MYTYVLYDDANRRIETFAGAGRLAQWPELPAGWGIEEFIGDVSRGTVSLDTVKLVDVLQRLHLSRHDAQQRGHDVRATSIMGIWDGKLRVADDTGAYDWHVGPHGRVVRVCVGTPSRATEAVCVPC